MGPYRRLRDADRGLYDGQRLALLHRSTSDSGIVLSANNVDVDARRHASFLKDYAPLAGRASG
jgi:hypothetical protein